MKKATKKVTKKAVVKEPLEIIKTALEEQVMTLEGILSEKEDALSRIERSLGYVEDALDSLRRPF